VLPTSHAGWASAGYGWTRRRQFSCGLVHASKWRRSTNLKFPFCRRPLQPWTQRGTLMSIWIVISRRRSMLAPFVSSLHFILSRLDYCNSLLYGIPDILFRRLQAVQNAAALLVTGIRKYDHITPVLHQLRWLPVRQRVEFKLAVLSIRRSTTYHRRICQTIIQLVVTVGRRQLRSSDSLNWQVHHH